MLEANVSLSDIEEVFLAGGSSRIPLVKKTLAKLFGKEPITSGNPDEAIALGAAIYAGYKTDKKSLNPLQAQAVSSMKFQEVAPAYFGTISRDSAKAAKGIQASLNNISSKFSTSLPNIASNALSVVNQFGSVSSLKNSPLDILMKSKA